MKRIAVLGAGYVGLVTSACLAEIGHLVWCIDSDESKVRELRRGKVPIYEPGLPALIAKNIANARLTFLSDLKSDHIAVDAAIIAVGTPPRLADGHADLSYVYRAAKDIADHIDTTCIITKSTVPVGTGDEIERLLRKSDRGGNIDVISNPEFLREGDAISDFMKPDRIIVGATHPDSIRLMEQIYAPIMTSRSPMIVTDRRTSELIKYAANAFLSMKLTFINEMADLCEHVEANIGDVSHGIGLDKRIGDRFLRAGPGYGGSCFPKDALALIKTAQDHGSPLRIMETVVQLNDQRKRGMARKVARLCGGSLQNKTVGVLGLTFKPNTDDVRASPAISLIQALQDRGALIQAYDPEGMPQAQRELCDVKYALDPYDCAKMRTLL